MTDTAAAEAPAESVPPEAAAAPAPEAELETEVNKSAREKVLDHLTDSEGSQTVAEIIQGTGLIRNTAEQAIFRAVQAGQIERTAPGVYRLAAPKPPRPPSPKPPPPSPAGHTDEEWIARIEAWQVNPASWNIAEDGPPPNDPNHRIPLDVVGRFKDRQARDAKEREKREATAARQAAADRELRAKRSKSFPSTTFCPPSGARLTGSSTRKTSRQARGGRRDCCRRSPSTFAVSSSCRPWSTPGRRRERWRRGTPQMRRRLRPLFRGSPRAEKRTSAATVTA